MRTAIDLYGRAAIVTGAGRGLGRRHARELAPLLVRTGTPDLSS